VKITALRLHNVRRFAGRGVAIEGIDDGVNVLSAANEHGKSTSFEALQALFFQPHSGAGKEIRRLQPYSGGNPLVEADILTPEGRFRLTKQFIGGKRATVTDLGSGCLVAQQDEAEQFIAEMVRGGASGPAGLLWVRQGVTGIEERSRSDEEGERRVREGLLTSVQGEVEAITGGRRMSAIMEACADELGRIATPTLRPKAGGAYAAAVDDLERLRATEDKLRREVDDLRSALDRRADAARRLAELEAPEEAMARRVAVTRAEAAIQQARSHGEALRTREAEAALARSRLDAAEKELADYRTSLARVRALGSEFAEAAQRRDVLRQRRGECQAAIDAAAAEAKLAEAGQREASGLLARLDAAMRARQAAEVLQGRRDRLAQAEALRQRLEAAEATLALVALPPDAIDRLQKLEIDIARLRAAEAASLPSVRIDYDEGVAPSVLADGAPLAGGEDRGVADRLVLTLPGIGAMTLRSNRKAGEGDALAKAEAKRRDLLASIGAEDLVAAQRRQAEARTRAAEVERQRIQFDHLAPEGLPALREEVARLEAVAPEAIEVKGDPDAAREALARADRRVEMARNAEREAGPALSRVHEAATEAEASFATVSGEISRLDALLGPEPDRAGRERDLAAAQAERQAAFAILDREVVALRERAPDLSSVEAALQRARSAESAATGEAGRLRETLAGLNGQIRTQSDEAVEETWQETKEALETAEARVRAFETETAVLNRLKTALQDSRSAARDLYLQPVLTELRPLLGMLFDDVTVTFDEKTLLPQAISRNGQEENVDRLSGGMREQLSVLTRLAFARLLARDGRAAPVILDDALVYSDDDRIEKMFDALHRQARDQQIIVFSCRQRAFSRLGGNLLHMVDWQPRG